MSYSLGFWSKRETVGIQRDGVSYIGSFSADIVEHYANHESYGE